MAVDSIYLKNNLGNTIEYNAKNIELPINNAQTEFSTLYGPNSFQSSNITANIKSNGLYSLAERFNFGDNKDSDNYYALDANFTANVSIESDGLYNKNQLITMLGEKPYFDISNVTKITTKSNYYKANITNIYLRTDFSISSSKSLNEAYTELLSIYNNNSSESWLGKIDSSADNLTLLPLSSIPETFSSIYDATSNLSGMLCSIDGYYLVNNSSDIINNTSVSTTLFEFIKHISELFEEDSNFKVNWPIVGETDYSSYCRFSLPLVRFYSADSGIDNCIYKLKSNISNVDFSSFGTSWTALVSCNDNVVVKAIGATEDYPTGAIQITQFGLLISGLNKTLRYNNSATISNLTYTNENGWIFTYSDSTLKAADDIDNLRFIINYKKDILADMLSNLELVNQNDSDINIINSGVLYSDNNITTLFNNIFELDSSYNKLNFVFDILNFYNYSSWS